MEGRGYILRYSGGLKYKKVEDHCVKVYISFFGSDSFILTISTTDIRNLFQVNVSEGQSLSNMLKAPFLIILLK